MFGGNRIADLGVGLHLEDKGFTSELAAATSEANAMVRDLDGKKAEVKLAADLSDLKRKEAEAEKLLDRWRKIKAEATLTADTKHAEEKITRLETRLRRLTAERHAVEVQVEDAGGIAKLKALQHELNATKRDARRMNNELDNGQGGILKWIRSLTQMTVRLGPFTSKVNQLGRALLLLGPVITGVAGNLVGLVSVAGAGLVGALGLGSAAIAGAGLAGLGLMGVIKPLVTEYKSLSTVSKAYTTAVLKYGQGSKQAVAAQKQFNQALKGVSPEARRAFQSLADVRIGWQKLTGPAREALMSTMGDGLKTVNALMPDFARNTNKTADVIKNQLGGAFAALRSSDGKSLINDVFGGFNKALPSMLHSLLQLGAAAGKFTAAFSRGPLQQSAAALDKWAQHVNDLASNRSKMDAFAQSMTSSFKSVIHLGAGATGILQGLLRGAFGSGKNTVKNLGDSWVALGKRMNSVTGQQKLASFFDQAATTSHLLWQSVKPLVGLFVQFATIMRPFSDVALQVAHGFAAIAAAVAQLAPAKAILEGLFALQTGRSLGRLFGKRSGISDLISLLPIGPGAGGRSTERAVARALEKRGITGAERGAGTSVVRSVAETAGGAGAAGLLSRAGIRGLLGRAGTGLAERAATAGPLLPIAGILGATYAAAMLTGHRSDRVNKIYARGNEGTAAATAARSGQQSDNSAVSKNIDSIKAARAALAGLHKEQAGLTKGSQAYRDSQLHEWDLHHKLTEAIKGRTQAAQKAEDQATTEVGGRQKMLRAVKDLNSAHIAELKSRIAAEGPGGRQQEDLMRLGVLTAAQARAEEALTVAKNRQAAASLNVQRAQKGFKPVTGAAAQSLGALDRLHPVIAGKIALKYESPKNAAAVGDAARRALGAGVSKQVVLKIIADSKNADAALRRLETARVHKLMLSVGITGADGVLSKLNAIDQKAIRQKIARIIEQGGHPTLSMIESIIQRQIRDKNFRIQTSVSEALAAIGLVRSGLSSIQSKSIAINIVKRTTDITTVETKRGHASGRRPGVAETSLVGEGHGHEYVVDPKRGVAFRTHGPMLTPLSDSAYVIPTETGFAARGRSILAQAAADLGIHAYRSGKSPSGSLTHGQKKADQKRAAKMPIPKRIQYGGVPEQSIQKERDKAQKEYQDRANKVKALDKQIASASASARPGLERKRERLVSGKGSHGGSLNALYLEYQKANDRYKKIHHFNAELDRLDTVQGTLAQKMGNDARSGNQIGYTADRKQRTSVLKRLAKLYTLALKYAKPGSALAADLGSKLAGVQGEQIDTKSSSYGSDSPTLDDFIKSHGLFGSLQNLQLALSTAQGTDSITDDAAAIGGLRGFYQSLAGRADLTTGERIEVTDTLNGLRDQLSGLTPSADTQAQIDQLNQQLTTMTNTAGLNAAFASVAGGYGDIGTGSFGSVKQAATGSGDNGQTPFVQNNYMLHPSDPSVLRAIGSAATAGLGLQGFPSAPRVAPGY